MLSGSRLAIVGAPEGAVVISPPPPPAEWIADVGAAVRDALRFPLAERPLEALVPRGGRATIVVAAGLARRPGRRELESLVSPDFALRFSGRVEVHDAEDPELVELGQAQGIPLRANRALLETDVVVTVTAAETALHGGPAALLAASGTESLRAATAASLVEPGGARGWDLALGLEHAL